jgi:endonuclease/exonuclease/phosphatase family metal-dependent hydrolase
MSRLLSILLVVLLVAVVPSSSVLNAPAQPMNWPDRGNKLVVMTSNVRTSNAPEDVINAWPYRLPLLAHVFRQEAPDIIALQEATPWQISGLQSSLPGFESVTTNIGDQEKGYPSILYRKERFALKGFERLFLSAVPQMVDSVSWGNPSPRCFTAVKLQDLVTGKEFIFASTHFDYQSPNARKESALQLARWVKEQGSTPVILAGDFNERADSEVLNPLRALSSAGLESGIPLSDSYDLAHEPEKGTLQGFSMNAKWRIDLILVSDDWKVENSQVVEYHKGKVFPSDHFPVVATLQFQKEPSVQFANKPETFDVKVP